MTEGLVLARAFAEHQPEAAARALEEIPSEAAALFLSELPPKLAAPVVEELSPGAAARRLSAMPPELAAAILMELDNRGCAAILRICNAESRRELLAQLPARRVQHFRRTLAYTLDTVGAWIDYDVPALPGTRSAAEALELLRQRNREDDTQVFVLRAGQQYAGIVSTTALIQAAPEALLSRIADNRARALSDGVDVDEIEKLDDWDRYSLLPVTAPDGSLLGGLSRAGLRRAMDSVFPQLPPIEPQSLISHLFFAYLRTGSEMMRLLIGHQKGASTTRDADER